ncbi:hypothetical protein [Streptomyces sp. NPDC059928]|uniref:hypothetical protein n=1 Tax=unclassified Streptomyces TaxID=2593676 RepID=UPI003651AE6C
MSLTPGRVSWRSFGCVERAGARRWRHRRVVADAVAVLVLPKRSGPRADADYLT